MKPKCLGHRTELFTLSYNSIITEKDDYWTIKTPAEPGFFWGNFVLFKDPPDTNCYDRWMGIYKKELNKPTPDFVALSFDCSEYNPENVQEFLENGFSLDVCKVLTITPDTIHKPPKFNPDITIKRIETGYEWEQLIDIHITPDWRLNKESEIPFIKKRMETLRQMCENGMGSRFGAVLNSKIVGDLGIYCDENVGRYSLVATHRDYRRIGVCGTLVYLTAQYAFEHMGADTLVMIADEFYHAAKVYESVGFKETEKMYSLQWMSDIYR